MKKRIPIEFVHIKKEKKNKNLEIYSRNGLDLILLTYNV